MISTELAAAIVSSVAALISVVSTYLFKRQINRERQAATERNKLDLFRHPLLRATVALYMRLDNILTKDFTVYLLSPRSTES